MSADLTDFQAFVLRTAASGLNRMASAYFIASRWPGWKRRAAHGALVGHVRRAGHAMEKVGLVCVLPAKDRWGSPTVCVHPAGMRWLALSHADPASSSEAD